MKTTIISCFYCLLAFFPAEAQEKPSPQAEVFFKKAISEINPRHVAWIKSTAKKMQEKNLSEADAKKMASQYGALDNMNNSDIEAMAFLVLMQASKDAKEDLKTIMENLKAINEQRIQIRNLQQDFELHKKDISRAKLDSIKLVLKKQPVVQQVNTAKVIRPLKMSPTNTLKKKNLTIVPLALTKEEIDKTEKEIKDKLDSLNEMDTTESRRLQMAMSRLSKITTELSNLMKKMGESSSNIIQNLK